MRNQGGHSCSFRLHNILCGTGFGALTLEPIDRTTGRKLVWALVDPETGAAVPRQRVQFRAGPRRRPHHSQTSRQPRHTRGQVTHVLQLVGNRVIRPVIDRIFPFVRTPDAMARAESRRTIGKVIVDMRTQPDQVEKPLSRGGTSHG